MDQLPLLMSCDAVVSCTGNGMTCSCDRCGAERRAVRDAEDAAEGRSLIAEELEARAWCDRWKFLVRRWNERIAPRLYGHKRAAAAPRSPRGGGGGGGIALPRAAAG